MTFIIRMSIVITSDKMIVANCEYEHRKYVSVIPGEQGTSITSY